MSEVFRAGSVTKFEDDLPADADLDDLTANMARILCAEAEAYLAKVATFAALYPEPVPADA